MSFPLSRFVNKKKKKRARIDNDSQPPSVKVDMPTNVSDDSESEIEKLIRTKQEMEVKLQEAQRKFLDQKMEAKARDFQDHIVSSLRKS